MTSVMGVCLVLALASMDKSIAGSIKAAPIYPHEEAYQRAPYILLARVVSFDTTKGALIEVLKPVRGQITSGKRLYLRDTSRFPFLNAPGTEMTVFSRDIEEDEAVLWQGATSGGILWGNHDTLELIATAYADPETSLTATHPRERLAAAYYLSTRRKVSESDKGLVMESLIWGLAQKEPEINQAALDALEALDIDVEKIAGPFHPGFRPELKREAARKLEAWWEKRQ